MEPLGRRAHLRLHYNEIKRPEKWGNANFLLSGTDIQVELEKTRDGALFRVNKYVFGCFRKLLFALEEEEYKSLRHPDGTINTISVLMKTRTVRLFKSISLAIYHLLSLLTLRTRLCIQQEILDINEKSEVPMHFHVDGFDCLSVERLANICVFIIYANDIHHEFVYGKWHNRCYHITPKYIKEIDNVLGGKNMDVIAKLKAKKREILAMKRIVIIHCLEYTVHKKLWYRKQNPFPVEEYLVKLHEKEKVEEARLVAVLLESAITHRRYKDVVISLLDPKDDWRVQISIDNRYKDLVSVYNGKDKKNNYYRIGSFEDIAHLIERVRSYEPVKITKSIPNGGFVNKHGIFKLNGRVVSYTNFNYYHEQEEDVANRDYNIILDSGIRKMSLLQLTNRRIYSHNNILVCIGFGWELSRQGHEDWIALEKKIGKVRVRPGEMQAWRFGILPLLFYVAISFLIYVVFTNVNFKREEKNLDDSQSGKVSLIDNLDRIGIVFAILTIVAWTFTNLTHTTGKLKDVLLWRVTFTKVSQVRKHFHMTRKRACAAFYGSRFLASLVGGGYDCYYYPGKTRGPLEMDEIAIFDEVIGRRSLVLTDKLIFQDKIGIRILKMPTKDGIACLKSEGEKFVVDEEMGLSVQELVDNDTVLFDQAADGGVMRTNFFIGASPVNLH